MAHNVEPMDIDNIDSDFDNKENSVHHNNVYPRTPCTEKGYEELDVSELNMKLRYSITPISTPMSKSYTANYGDIKHQESSDSILNANLTHSLNASISKSDVKNKSVKSLPLQSMNADQLVDSNRNMSVLRSLDAPTVITTGNATITVTEPNDIDENLSIVSSLSSNGHTPELTTPTKGITATDGGSPIMRGLKTVLNMFRSSQSPIPPESEVCDTTQVLSPSDLTGDANLKSSQAILASTPITAHRNKEANVSKRNSPLKESIVFNEDLEKELLWKDETTILFSEEKIPIHKLFFQQPIPNISGLTKPKEEISDDLNSTVEYMEISYNNSSLQNKTITDVQSEVPSSFVESEGEFVDCETTLNENSHNLVYECGKNEPLGNENITNVLAEKIDNVDYLPSQLLDKNKGKISPTIPNSDNSEPLGSSLRILELNESKPRTADNLDVVDNGDKSNAANVSTNPNENIVKERMPDSIISDKIVKDLDSEAQIYNQPQLNIPKSDKTTIQDSINVSKENTIIMLSSEPLSPENNLTIMNYANTLITEDIKNKNEAENNQDIPANIPLPDEDETESNLVPNNVFTKLESILHVDNMQIETISPAKPINKNKAINENITSELDGTQNVKNSDGQILNSIQITENNINLDHSLKIKTDDFEFRQSVLTDINNIINDAQDCVNRQQNDLLQTTSQLNAIEAGVSINLKTNEITEKNFSDMELKQGLSVKCANSNLETENIHKNKFEKHTSQNINLAAMNQIESKPNGNQFKMSIEVGNIPDTENDLKPIEHTLSGSTDTSMADNNSLKINNHQEPQLEIETLPDVIPNLICDTPVSNQSISVENNFNTEKILDETDKITEEIVNEQSVVNKDEAENNVDVEITVSERDSQIDGKIEIIPEHSMNFGNIENPFTTKSDVVISPPVSPQIVSKGYNFDFGEIDDPFATKTKIRMSPPLYSPKNTTPMTEKAPKVVYKYRRNSQSERKKPGLINEHDVKPVIKLDSDILADVSEMSANDGSNKKVEILESNNVSVTNILQCESTNLVLNAEIESQFADKGSQMNYEEARITNAINNENNETKIFNKVESEICMENSKSSLESLHNSNYVKNTSSSEQSTYYSAGNSWGENFVGRNVFNIPEIEEFNPITSKSKMRLSPPMDKQIESSSEINSSSLEECKKITEDKDVGILDDCVNASNTTTSSKSTDEKDITVQEVFTEDEDTVEGPFLEAEDEKVDDKMSDFDGKDLMMFSELPKQVNEDNLDGGELFIDAEAFEFLLNQNQSNAVTDSAKESLFLKFDPLFAKRVSTDGVLSVLKKVQKRQSTPQKTSVSQQLNSTFEKHIAGPSNVNVTQDVSINVTAEESSDDINVTVTKPMMAVTPAVNPIVPSRNKSSTPTSSNRRSITFTSPAIAVIDRLLSMSGNNSMLGDTTVTQINTEQNEAELALTELRELLADKEMHVYNLRSETRELKDRLSNLESQMRTLESESETRLKKVNELNEKLCEKTKLNKSMAGVVEEYERTIASLIAEIEQDKKRNNEEKIKLIQERDEQTTHLASMEVSFSDLHSKYEKSKQIILTCKANEDAYKKSIKVFEDNVSKLEANYELLKQHATSKLNHANQELEKLNRGHEAEVLKLNAMIKRKDLHITSLEETLAQKTKANEELAAICDELINKVG